MAHELSRRQVLVLSALAAASFVPIHEVLAASESEVDCGEVGRFDKDGVYAEFQPKGFHLIRREGKLVALSSVCTHKACKVSLAGEVFACKCHGSKFSLTGTVLRPPARKDLPRYSIRLDEQKHVIVNTQKQVKADQANSGEAALDVG